MTDCGYMKGEDEEGISSAKINQEEEEEVFFLFEYSYYKSCIFLTFRVTNIVVRSSLHTSIFLKFPHK